MSQETQPADCSSRSYAETFVPVVPPSMPTGRADRASWSYDEAFARNRGLISPEEQQRLRNSRVAIVGMGGVGGIHLVTLARLGIGRFTIADPDVFETVNFNRQYGATLPNLGRQKAEVMAEIARDINPEAEIRVFTDPIGPANAGRFLEKADLFIDGLDFFQIDARRVLFRLAASQGTYSITAGPVGFSAIWIVFAPNGMSFDKYFDMSNDMGRLEQLVAFGVGVAPKATQRSYMDLDALDIESRAAPSTAMACQLAAGAMGCEAVKILLGKRRIKVAPYYQQFDPFLGRFICGRLRGGNRHPLQRLKRWWLTRYMRRRAARQPSPEEPS
jgi:molybdopterin/thiamine biosynthesis adenylyltransferase